ncbi:tyrosine-type recombinase/integrase [Flavobacterium sp. W21_SRS_FM6]|uniref:tyrosine-type recombinase/integrase n=1 Tax=Flavobacterium sp. W21_SRS_FM6 TaxID=3240268 RepID=UPI003F90280A
MSITNQQIKALVCPTDRKQVKKSIGDGLFILVKTNGSKLWRFRYKYASKHQEMAIGKYPTVSLSKAKEMVQDARALLREGINPMEKRKERKRMVVEIEMFFEPIAMEWWRLVYNSKEWSEDHADKVKRWISKDTKIINKLHIKKINGTHINDIMNKIKESGFVRKAPDVLSMINRVFKYAKVKGYTENNPAENFPLTDLIGALPRVQHYSAITSKGDLAQLIYDVDNNNKGNYCSIEALKLAPRLLLRPGEVRLLKWEYVDLNDHLIRIPAEKIKNRANDHLVPLSKQMLYQFEEIKKYTGYSSFVFPNQNDTRKTLSKNVLANRLRALGYDAEIMSAHGFRTTASTNLYEMGYAEDVVETQLAHLLGNTTRQSYNRAKYLPQRREMMQHWSDLLDELKDNL